jgi:hypothetical protein
MSAAQFMHVTINKAVDWGSQTNDMLIIAKGQESAQDWRQNVRERYETGLPGFLLGYQFLAYW